MGHTREENVLELNLQLLLLRFLQLREVDEEEDLHPLILELNFPPHAADKEVVDHDLHLLSLCSA